jgi:hypothetical protein
VAPCEGLALEHCNISYCGGNKKPAPAFAKNGLLAVRFLAEFITRPQADQISVNYDDIIALIEITVNPAVSGLRAKSTTRHFGEPRYSRPAENDPELPLGLLQSRRIWLFSNRSEHSETREQCATIHHPINSACTRSDCGIVN